MSSVQCEGTTKTGTRCRKNTKDTSRLCHNHRVDASTRVSRPRAPRPSVAPSVSVATVPTVPIISSVHTYTIQTRSKRRAAMAILRSSPARSPIRVVFSPVRLSPARVSPARLSPVRLSPVRLSNPVHITIDLTGEDVPEDRVKPRPTHRPRPRPRKQTHEHHHSEQDDCCVCYEKMPTSDALGCTHLVCQDCVKKLRDDSCPMCRAPVKSKYLTNRDKAKIARRKQQDAIDRANESFRSYLASQAQLSPIYTGPSRVPIMLGVYHM